MSEDKLTDKEFDFEISIFNDTDFDKDIMFIKVSNLINEILPTATICCGRSLIKDLMEKESYIEQLEDHLKTMVEGYEQWEADIISENKLWWPHSEKDAISGKLYDDMMLLQEKRNEAKQTLQSKLK